MAKKKKKNTFLKNNWPWMAGVVVALVAAGIVFFFWQIYPDMKQSSSDNGVAATVNGVEITNKEVNEAVQSFRDYYVNAGYIEDTDEAWVEFLEEAGYTEEAFREYIITYDLAASIVIEQDAEKNGVEVSDEDIQSQVDMYVSLYGQDDEEALATAMGYASVDAMKKDMKSSMLRTELYEAVIDQSDPTDEEVQEYLDENYSEFTGRKSTHILFGANQKEYAQSVLDRLNAGEDFDTLYSECAAIADEYTEAEEAAEAAAEEEAEEDSEATDEEADAEETDADATDEDAEATEDDAEETETVADEDKKVIQASEVGWDNEHTGQSLDEGYQTALDELEKGECTTELVESSYGWHIIRCDDTFLVDEDAETVDLSTVPEDILEDIKADLADEKYDTACEEYLEALIESADIQIVGKED